MPDDGSVFVNGKDVTVATEEERTTIRREQLGFVFQAFRLFESLTAFDNVALSWEIAGQKGKQACDKAEQCLDLLEMKNKKHLLSLMLLFICATIMAQPGFHLIKKTTIGGEGGWDYLSVDSENRRLYVSHSTQAEILNADTHEKIGAIAGLQGVHGIIAVPESGRGITTNGRSNTATIFDLKTLKTIVELPTGKNPDALLYDKFSKRVFVFNHSDVTTTAIDISEGKVVGTIDLGGTALEAGATDEKGTIFVNLEDAGEIVSFNAKTLAIKSKWKLSPCEEPTGLAIDIKNKRLFSVCHNGSMMVIDSESLMTFSKAGRTEGNADSFSYFCPLR